MCPELGTPGRALGSPPGSVFSFVNEGVAGKLFIIQARSTILFLFCALISYHPDLSPDSVLPRGNPPSPAFPLLLSLTMGTQAGVETKQAAGADISSMKPQGSNLHKKPTPRH